MIIVQREDSQVVEKDIPGLYMIYISKRMEKEFTVAGFSKKEKSAASSQEDTSQKFSQAGKISKAGSLGHLSLFSACLPWQGPNSATWLRFLGSYQFLSPKL